MINILTTKKFFEQDLEILRKGLSEKCNLIIPDEFSEDFIANEVEKADVLLGGLITEKILSKARKLKLIQIPWTGVDNLDFALLRKYNIPTCNSHSNAQIVAEHAVALLLSLAKKIPYHDRLLREGIWNRPGSNNTNEISPFSFKIHGQNVGIVGYGSIGKKIKNMLSVFNCSFLIVDNDPNYDHDDKAIKQYEAPQNLRSVLARSDIVFVAVPLTENTKNLFSKEEFEVMKKQSLFINISRGEVIHEEALYNALKEQKIAGAAIDTWYNYPNPKNPVCFPSKSYPFHELNNLVISPHRAGFISGDLPHLHDAIENINSLAEGNVLKNIISIDNKY